MGGEGTGEKKSLSLSILAATKQGQKSGRYVWRAQYFCAQVTGQLCQRTAVTSDLVICIIH